MSTLTQPQRRPGAGVQLRRVIAQHPRLIKNNRVYYEVARSRAYRRFATDRALTDRADLVDQLVERGIAIVPDFVCADQVARYREAAEAALVAARRGELPEYVFTTQPEVLCRIGKAHESLPATRSFFEDATVTSVLRAYMSSRAASYRREADYRYGLGKTAQADLYHFDNWRPICKAFLYLTDVGEENAPFVYVPGSHRQEPWRTRHNLAYDVDGRQGRFGHFFPQEMRELRTRFGWEDVVCTGRAGTLILADLRGLHRGTPLVSGERIMLTNAFDLMSPGLAGS